MPLFEELKRRNVLRVAALYGAVAWLLLQIADVIVEPLGLPAWTLRMLFVMVAIGFLVTIVVAWSYELTSDGLVPDAQAAVPGKRPASGGRKLDFAILAVLCVALAYFVVNRRAAEPEAVAFRAPTLAVLPFKNLGEDPEDVYFADGLSEELQDLLGSVEGLRVAGRSSSFYFRDRAVDLREIGRQLGVAHVLEGTVRRAGPQVRVTAQLSDASDGSSLWSGTYDRKLTDVQAIQAEIGAAVAEALQLELLGAAGAATRLPRADPQAYPYYLVARARLQSRGLENLRAAVPLFDRAIGADRAFADAYAGKALALLLLYDNHEDGDANQRFDSAQAALRRALELDPESAAALTAAGLHAQLRSEFVGETSAAEADRYFERALAANPRSTAALYWHGRNLRERDPQRSLELMQKVIEIDPLELPAAVSRAGTLSAMGRGEEARAEFERILQAYPESTLALRAYADNEVAWGRLAHAHALAGRILGLEGQDDPWPRLLQAQVDLALGRRALATARLDRPAGSPLADWMRTSLRATAQRDYPALYRNDRRNAALDATVRHAELYSALLVGRDAEALAIARELVPELFGEPPRMPDAFVCEAGYVALALQRQGDDASARRVAEAALAQWDGLPGRQEPNDVACRAGLLRMSGRSEESVAEFTRAVDLGFRGIVPGSAVPVEDHPLFGNVAGDAGMQAPLERIRGKLAQERRDLESAEAATKEKAASG